MSSILGHKKVKVKKDSKNLSWSVNTIKDQELFNISFAWAFKADESKSKDFYNALVTAMSYFPLTDQEIEETKKRFKSLRSREILDVAPAFETMIESYEAEDQPTKNNTVPQKVEQKQIIKKGRNLLL